MYVQILVFVYHLYFIVIRTKNVSFNQHIYGIHFRCEYMAAENGKLPKCFLAA